jgi:hypothetical protein
LRFASLCPKNNLDVYGVPEDSLKNYRSNNNGNHTFAFDCKPDGKYKLIDESVIT